MTKKNNACTAHQHVQQFELTQINMCTYQENAIIFSLKH